MKAIFTVGPSKVSDEVKADIQQAAETGVLEISHRSEAFSAISEKTVKGLQQYFSIPRNHTVLFTSSATECMELLIKSCVEKESFHFVNGAFSGRFAEIAESMGKRVLRNEVPMGQQNDFSDADIPETAEMVALTYNETSTGVMCGATDISFVRKKTDALLVVDATSNAGAVDMPIAEADAWFFSVQKCFGLPAGLGVMIVNERVVKKAAELAAGGAFTLPEMVEKMHKNYQTLATPNVLNIFLLAQQLERWNADGGLQKRINQTQDRMKQIEDLVEESQNWKLLPERQHRSTTVCCVQSEEERLAGVKKYLQEQHIEISSGYGDLKPTTIRIGNFPSITDDEFTNFKEYLKKTL